MTTEKKVARRKLSLLELASDLSNVSKACRVMGYSRQQFYEIRRNTKRPHQGRGMKGRTPYKVFVAGLPKEEQPAPPADQVAA